MYLFYYYYFNIFVPLFIINLFDFYFIINNIQSLQIQRYSLILTTKEVISMQEIKDLLKQEEERQENEICLIASENYASKDVLAACGHCIQNKYSEGYVPKNGVYRRYYAGCSVVDKIEQKAIDLVCQAFNCKYANVQSHCGSSANLAVYVTAMKYWKCDPKEITVIGQCLDAGCHLSHGTKVSVSGVFFKAKQYGLDENELFNYKEVEDLVKNTEGHIVLVIGYSAYPRFIDYKRIADFIKSLDREIFILHDVSHFAGLIVGGVCDNPLNFDYGDKAKVLLVSTTHKTLRMARHAIIATNNIELETLIDKAVFPFLNGGPLQNMIAGIAVGFTEALTPEYKEYAKQIVKNIKAMEGVFKRNNVKMVSGGSDNHLILIDLRNNNITGRELEKKLEDIGIICNKNAVKNDPRSKIETSGIRIGTAAVTTRGFKEKDCEAVAEIISSYINNKNVDEEKFRKIVKDLCKEHKIYA